MASTANTSTFDLVVVSNRLPVDRKPAADHGDKPVTTPGGLVAALRPVIEGKQAAWVGWPGIADQRWEAFHGGDTYYSPVELTAAEVQAHYEGFSNSTIWPLYHDAIVAPVFDETWWETYQGINARFAVSASEVAAEGATVWIHDYQLQLVPEFLRALRPDCRIGYFHHIPFPELALFRSLPWAKEILRGLLGADLIGLQRQSDVEHLEQAVADLLGLQVDSHSVAVPELVASVTHQTLRTAEVGAFPISLDVAEIEQVASRPEVKARAKAIRQELGNPEHLFLGVDRLDYTKGILERLKAFDFLLREGQLDASSSVFVQLASPSRETVASYQQLREDVEALVAAINARYPQDKPPVVYRSENISREEMMAMYLSSDVMVVTPLRDGMNLVAKEFVSARLDHSGVLVLSQFAGAADELREAVIVNPTDINQLAHALGEAAAMSHDEARKRMAAMRDTVTQHDVSAWAHSFLARLVKKESS